MNSTVNQLRRRNHYVPASYLAAFTDTGKRDGSLWVYERSGVAVKHLRLNNTALEKNLYVRTTDQGADDAVERFFADSIEGPFAEIRNRIVNSARAGLIPSAQIRSSTDREIVARFLAFQLLRTPVERDANLWLSELGSLAFFRESLDQGGYLRAVFEQILQKPLSPAEIANLRETISGLPGVRSGTSDWLPRTLRNAERYAQQLMKLEWRVLTVPRTVELVTCDMPVVAVARHAGSDSFELGRVISEPDFEVTLALSPAHVVLVAHGIDDERFLRSERFADSVRRRTITNASRWVFARSKSESITAELENSPKPEYYIEFNQRTFPVGYPVKELDRLMRVGRVSSFQFRYGVRPS